jgi:hypothetical protein
MKKAPWLVTFVLVSSALPARAAVTWTKDGSPQQFDTGWHASVASVLVSGSTYDLFAVHLPDSNPMGERNTIIDTDGGTFASPPMAHGSALSVSTDGWVDDAQVAALDSTDCIAVDHDGFTLEYRTGTISGGQCHLTTLIGTQYQDVWGSTTPRIASDGNTFLVEVHAPSAGTIWIRPGYSGGGQVVNWGQSLEVDAGYNATVTQTDDDSIVVVYTTGQTTSTMKYATFSWDYPTVDLVTGPQNFPGNIQGNTPVVASTSGGTSNEVIVAYNTANGASAIDYAVGAWPYGGNLAITSTGQAFGVTGMNPSIGLGTAAYLVSGTTYQSNGVLTYQTASGTSFLMQQRFHVKGTF